MKTLSLLEWGLCRSCNVLWASKAFNPKSCFWITGAGIGCFTSPVCATDHCLHMISFVGFHHCLKTIALWISLFSSLRRVGVSKPLDERTDTLYPPDGPGLMGTESNNIGYFVIIIRHGMWTFYLVWSFSILTRSILNIIFERQQAMIYNSLSSWLCFLFIHTFFEQHLLR